VTALERAASRIATLARHAVDSEEICGLVFGDGFVWPLPNRAKSPGEEYFMALEDIEGVVRAKGAPVAVFHSHPGQDDPWPSAADTEQLKVLARTNSRPVMLIAGKTTVRAFTWDDGVEVVNLAADP